MKQAMVQTSTRRMRIRVGDIIEGAEGSDVARLEITYIGRGYPNGEPLIVCRRLPSRLEGDWTLTCRNWRRVGSRGGKP